MRKKSVILRLLGQLSGKAVTDIMKRLSQLSGKAVIAIMKKLSQLSGKAVIAIMIAVTVVIRQLFTLGRSQ